jgi:magnesium-transporting ATPase (P-type)
MGNITLLCKGADNVIMERLAPAQAEDSPAASKTLCNTAEHTQNVGQHLNQFACDGFRTLCFSGRPLSRAEYDEWSHAYHEASVSLTGRSEQMEAVAERLEHSLVLYGCTAVEDRLQDGVPEVLRDLRQRRLALSGHRHDVVSELLGIRLCHRDILPARTNPHRSDVNQTRGSP